MGNTTWATMLTLGCPQNKSCTDAVKCAWCFVAFKSALPYDYQSPSGVAPCRFIAVVALDVFRSFLHPERDVRLRHYRVLTSMPVPETATHVNDCFCFGNNNIRLALKSLVVHSISPTKRKWPFAHKNLWQSILAVNLRHQAAALLWADFIHKRGVISRLISVVELGKGDETVVFSVSNHKVVEKNNI